MYHVEFKVPGGNSDAWHSAYGTFETRQQAKKFIKDSKRSLREEGNPVGAYRIAKGRGKTPAMPINWAEWGFIGLLAWILLKDD